MNRKPNKKRNILTILAILLLVILLWMVTRMAVGNYGFYEDVLQETSIDTSE